MTQPAAPLDTRPHEHIRNTLLKLLVGGPTLAQVAIGLLKDTFKQHYPHLNIDPDHVVVGEPNWALVDGDIVPRPTVYLTLTSMLLERAAKPVGTMLIEGHHFLTRLPLTTPEVHLPVRIEQVGRLLDELAHVLPAACQERQLDYWNTPLGTAWPRWKALAQRLRSFWSVSEDVGWSAAECAMARRLYTFPDLKERQRDDPFASHAYLIDVDEVVGDRVEHLKDNWAVVLIGRIAGKETLLSYSMNNGYERFDSQQELERALAPDLDLIAGCRKIQWRLYEPAASIFDNLACAIIARQTDDIVGIGLKNTAPDQGTCRAPARLGSEDPRSATSPEQTWFEQQIPDWLLAASASEQNQFAQYLAGLAFLGNDHGGATYLDGVPTISDYASGRLKARMEADHADALNLDPRQIEVEVRRPVMWAMIIVPGQYEDTRLSLVELALRNLIALPFGDKILRSTDDGPLPDWLTVDYVEALIAEVDIGRSYLELVRRTLRDDPRQAKRREELYISQLRIQLPLLALEFKLRDIGNLDETGCRYMAALMQSQADERQVDGHPIVIRRLAFVSQMRLGSAEDVVGNMFVIGPRDPDAGPCLLYRPMFDPQLMQFPSPSNLFYAIQQDDPLRQSVLAWLPEQVRSTYGRFIFPGHMASPWAVLEFAATPLAALLDSRPVQLSDTSLGEDFLPLLFRANVDALVDIADQQSVSNSESRWQTFETAGWLLLNVALPYLNTTAGTTLWLRQILEDADQLTQSQANNDSLTRQGALLDLLMNMALALSTHAINRTRKAVEKRPVQVHENSDGARPDPSPLPERTVERLPSKSLDLLPAEHHWPIHSSGAVLHKPAERTRLLETFSTDVPQPPGPAQADGVFKGLYGQGRHRYAKVQGKWFNVLTRGEQVCIVDAHEPHRTGPPLTRDAAGNWHVDSRLRLRDGGVQGVREKLLAHARHRAPQLLAELNRFEEHKPQALLLLKQDAEAVQKAPAAEREAKTDAYLATLQQQREEYEKALRLLIEWPSVEPLPESPRARLGYLKAQIAFTFAEISVLDERLHPIMDKALDLIANDIGEPRQAHVDTAQDMLRLGEDMLERLDYIETRLRQLKALGRVGFEHVRDCRTRMPRYKRNELRLVRLSLYRYLCLSLDSLATLPEAWAQVDQMVDIATVSFQSLCEAIDEHSAIRLDEQIEALNSLTEQFTALDEHLEFLADEYSDSVRPAHLERLRKEFAGLGRRALRHLGRALDKRTELRGVGDAYQPRPIPRKKFIRARYWGMVCGEPRLSGSGEETDLIDVRHPFTQEIIVTFHRKETGEWVPRIKPERHTQVPPLAVSLAKGNALLDGLEGFQERLASRVARPERTPTGVGFLLNAHAARMEKVSLAMRKALEQNQGGGANDTVAIPAGQRDQATSLINRLEERARALHDQAISAISNAIRQSPPTMSGVLWLRNRHQIAIHKINTRKRHKGPLYNYFDRYEIKDLRDKKTLWYADFFYSRHWLPAPSYLFAHLTSPDHISTAMPLSSTEELNRLEQISQYRSEIAVDQAREVFFNKPRASI